MSEISSVTDPHIMNDPFLSGYVKRDCVQQVLPTFAESRDELAKSTYDVAIYFWILFTKKMNNVDKGILE